LKRANNVNSFNSYSNFVDEFALSKNAKEREISNFIDVKIENFDDVIKENNNNQEIRHMILGNAKTLSYNYYEITNVNNNNEEKNANNKDQDCDNKNNNEIESDLNQIVQNNNTTNEIIKILN